MVHREPDGTIQVFVNAFWKWKFGCAEGVYGALAFDRLHVAKGLIGDLITALDWLLGTEQPPGSALSAAGVLSSYVRGKHSLMDRRFSRCTAYLGGSTVYLPRLSGGFYSKKRAEVRLIVQLYLIICFIWFQFRLGTSTFGCL